MSAESESSANTRRDLLLILGLAFVWRLLFLLGIPRVIDTADAIHYLAYAEHLRTGEWLAVDPKIPLGYPALAALAGMLVDDIESAARFVSFLASLLLVVPVYRLARALHGRPVACVAATTVAIWPWLADYGSRVSTEALAVTLWFTAVYLLLRAARGPGLYGLYAAAALAGLYLTRPEGLFILLAAIPSFLLFGGRAGLRRLAGMAAVLVPVIVANMLYVRTLTGKTTANYRVGFIVNEFDMARFLDTVYSTLSQVIPVMLGPVLILFLVVGLLWPRDPDTDRRAGLFVLYFALVQWLVTLPVLSPAPRYLMATIIVLSLWSARGVVIATQRLGWREHGKWLRLLPGTALVCVMLYGTAATIGGEYLGHRPRAPREYKAAGEWMKANLAPGLVFTRKPQVGWYAGMPSTGPALDDTLDAALSRARAAGALYLVVDERYTIPGLATLLDPAQAPAGLVPRYTNDAYPESRIVVYELAEDEL